MVISPMAKYYISCNVLCKVVELQSLHTRDENSRENSMLQLVEENIFNIK